MLELIVSGLFHDLRLLGGALLHLFGEEIPGAGYLAKVGFRLLSVCCAEITKKLV